MFALSRDVVIKIESFGPTLYRGGPQISDGIRLFSFGNFRYYSIRWDGSEKFDCNCNWLYHAFDFSSACSCFLSAVLPHYVVNKNEYIAYIKTMAPCRDVCGLLR